MLIKEEEKANQLCHDVYFHRVVLKKRIMRPFLMAGLKNKDLANFIKDAKMTYIIGDNTTEDMRMLHSDAIILFEKEGFRPFSIIFIAEHKANIGKGDVLQLAKYTIAELDTI